VPYAGKALAKFYSGENMKRKTQMETNVSSLTTPAYALTLYPMVTKVATSLEKVICFAEENDGLFVTL
jgi:hypothetical protein